MNWMQWGQRADKFGHEDYRQLLSRGKSSKDMMNWFKGQNLGTTGAGIFSANNAPGAVNSGQWKGEWGLYDQIAADAESAKPDFVAGKGSDVANTASGIKRKRSQAAKSGASSRGTQQLARSMFINNAVNV